MGRLIEPTIEEMQEKNEKLSVREEMATREANIAEREAVVKQLKKQYGRDWASTLGISKFTDMQTLKSFLGGAKNGIENYRLGVKMNDNTSHTNPMLSPLPPARRQL